MKTNTIHSRRIAAILLLAILIPLLLSARPAAAQALPDYGACTPSPVIRWNEAALAAIRNHGAKPTVVTRQLFLLHTAMYDAWSAYDSIAQPVFADPVRRQPVRQHTAENKAVAVTAAARQVLTNLFPAYAVESGAFTQLVEILGYDAADASPDAVHAAEIGLAAAQDVLAARQNDGSNAENGYADAVSELYPVRYQPVNRADTVPSRASMQHDLDPNHWQPLRVATGRVHSETGDPIVDEGNPASYYDQSFLTPHWGAVRPFALKTASAFRPPAPPQAGSHAVYTDALGNTMTNDEAYRLQFAELLTISAQLGDREKAIAEFWADGPRTETPPGHWNQLAQGIAYRDCHTIDEDVKLFFALNATLLDTSIAVWETKRYYDSVRPQTALRHLFAGKWVMAWGGPNQGTKAIRGEEWMPYQLLTFVTPPFPEYVSGHSAFSAASAEVLTSFTGSNRFYDGETALPVDLDRNGVPDLLGQFIMPAGGFLVERGPASAVVLRWETFQQAADEAALSRRYGGIHIQDGDLHGRTLGRRVAEACYRLAESYWNGTVTD
jgi:hypothetical protein